MKLMVKGVLRSGPLVYKLTAFLRPPRRIIRSQSTLAARSVPYKCHSMASPINISDSDNDEDVKKAIALSMMESPPAAAVLNAPVNDRKVVLQDNIKSTTSLVEGTKMDMQALRQARLARFGTSSVKRERSISPPELTRPAKVLKTAPTKADTSIPSQLPLTPSAEPSPLQYPKGVVKKTWAHGLERTDSDIKIEEVLERTTLRTAVLSAFQWDTAWLLSKVNFPATRLIFIKQGKTEADREHDRNIIKGIEGSLELCFPPMEGQTVCMHSKLMLLFHPHKLRIVVPSANLMDYDWGETGIMENTVFLIDLLRLQGGKQKIDDMPFFGQELMYFLEKQGLSEKARDGILNFDFGATKNMAFVHSVGGLSFGQEMQRTGYTGLSKAVRTLNLDTSDDLQIDFAAASLGSLTIAYLHALHSAARGELSTINNLPTPHDAEMGDRFRIYFPTLDTVHASKGGASNADTVCFQRRWYESSKFPKNSLRDYQSVRPGMLSHNKILYARGLDRTEGVGIAWAYVGSANLSESAWGKLTMDKKRKELKMSLRNWECGVLICVPKAAEGDAVPELDVFDGVVDVPFKTPAAKYEEKQPWFFMDRRA